MPNLTEDWLFVEDKLEPDLCSTCCITICNHTGCPKVCPACMADKFLYYSPKDEAHKCSDFEPKDESYVSPTQR